MAEAFSAVTSALSSVNKIQQYLDTLKDFNDSPINRLQRRGILKEFLPRFYDLSDEIAAIHRLVASLKLFCDDYRDQNVMSKITEFNELAASLDNFSPALVIMDFTQVQAWFPGNELDRLLQDARAFHNNLQKWVQDVFDSPVTAVVEEVDTNIKPFREYTYSTFHGNYATEKDQQVLANVKDVDSWVFYKLYQKWVSTAAVLENSTRMARMNILFWNLNTINVMPKLFKSILSPATLEEITGLLKRPACSLKIWTQEFKQLGPESGPSGIPLNAGLRMLKARLARTERVRVDRLRRTAHLRERSQERRPYPKDSTLREDIEPSTTTFILYHAPVALSRNQEDWSLFGAICHDHHRAVSIIACNTYFQNAPKELESLVSGDYHNEQSVEMGPPNLILAMIRLLTDKDAAEVTRHAANIYDIERKLRLFIPDDLSHSASGIDLDFQILTTTLSSAISRLNFHQMRLNGNLTVVKKLLDQIPHYFGSQYKEHNDFKRTAEALQTSIENWLTDVNFNLEIGKTQLQVAYTMISQRDARDSIQLTKASRRIAEAAKSDSSIMKMLAVLGAVFLPGTYISALFSMNMFDWQAGPGEHVVSQHFWIYWVITVPITVLVASFVTLFIFFKTSSRLGRKSGER